MHEVQVDMGRRERTGAARARGRRRRKPVEVVHDRRAITPAVNPDIRDVVVDDPYEPGGKIVGIASIRDDPLGRLHARRQIDEAQYHAGRHYQYLCEVREITALRAMDTTYEPVDQSGVIHNPYNDRKRRAMLELQHADLVLGRDGAKLCRNVLESRKFVEQVARDEGHFKQRDFDFYGRYFRNCLDVLAGEFGYAMDATARTT